MRLMLILSVLVVGSGACGHGPPRTDYRDIVVYKGDQRIARGLKLADDAVAPEEFAHVSYLVLRWQSVCAAQVTLQHGKHRRSRVKKALREIESVLLEHERTPWMRQYKVVCDSVPPPETPSASTPVHAPPAAAPDQLPLDSAGQ